MEEVAVYPWTGVLGDLRPHDRFSVAQLVVDGGAIVGNRWQLISRLQNAHLLALLRECGTDRIVGVAALKRPDAVYRRNKFEDAGVAITGYEAAPELGYVVVALDMRGKRLSGLLVDLVAKENREPAFATTDSDTMKNNLARSGFTRIGREWSGNKGILSLWTIAPHTD